MVVHEDWPIGRGSRFGRIGTKAFILHEVGALIIVVEPCAMMARAGCDDRQHLITKFDENFRQVWWAPVAPGSKAGNERTRPKPARGGVSYHVQQAAS